MIKTGIIGYGYMGEIRRRVVENHSDMELSIICESNSQKNIENASKFKVTRSPKDVLDSDVDLIFVCTPNNIIPELTIESLKRGKHVFCEKPPGCTLQDIINIREQELKSKTSKLMFGFNHRYHPGIQRARKLINSGKMGELIYMRGVYGKSGGSKFKESWRNKKDISGGGILLDQGIHMLDLFCYFAGDFPRVKSFLSNRYWATEVEDNAFVILENDKQQHASLHSSATLWKHRFQIEFGLEKGYALVQGLLSKTGSYGRETLIIGRQEFEDETEAMGNPSEEIIYFDKDLSWEYEVNSIAQSIKNNTPVTESTSEEAVRVMRIIDQAYQQAEK